MCKKIKVFLPLIVIILSLGPGAAAQEQYRTRVAIIPMENNTGDTQYDAVCETVTDTVGLVLQFLKDYLVFTADQVPELAVLPDLEPDTLIALGQEQRFDEIIFGSAELRDEGGFRFSLSIFNTIDGKIQVEETAEAETIFDIFDAADQITLALISTISDIHIGFGAIRLERGEGYGSFEVYLDGKPVPNYNRVFRKVLNGSYLLSIRQDRLLGDTEIFSRQVEVLENQTVTVAFDIPGASPEEFAFLDREAGALYSLAENPENIEEFLSGIAEFQGKTQRTGHDRELESVKNEILKSVGETAVAVLEELKAGGDALYYAPKPDFPGALGKYRTVSDLLNNIFDYQIVDDEALELQTPDRIAAAGDDTFFIIDNMGGNLTLRSFDFTGNELARLNFDIPGGSFAGGICTDVYGKLYLFNPEEPVIKVFDRSLNLFETIDMPDYEAGDLTDAKLARSDSGLLYIVSSGGAVVFDPAGEVDPDTEITTVSRSGNIEQVLMEVLQTGFPVSSLFFDGADRLNIFSADERKLLRFDVFGNFHSEILFPESVQFSQLAIDAIGYFYLTRPSANEIHKYNPAGELVTAFGSFGQAPGEYSRVESVSVAADGTILVADTYNHRLQIQRLASPPVLFPAISTYGVEFKRRVSITENAIERLASSLDRVKAGPVVGKFIGSGIFIGGALGLHYAADYLKAEYLSDYTDYRQATVTQEVLDLHSSSTLMWYLSLVADIGNLTFFGIGSMFLTSAVLDIFDAAGIGSRVTKNLQRLSMDRDYELDRDKFKSLRATQSVGFWTGIMPVIAGTAALGTYIGLNYSDINFTIVSAITVASVAIPPIFSHLYGGKFHFGLMTMGLISDAMAVAALLMIHNAGEEGHPAFQRDLEPGPASLERTVETIGIRLPMYLMIGAMCTRLAAGSWDRNHGWQRAHEHNRYAADIAPPAENDISFNLLPQVTVDGRFGFAGNISF